MSSSFPSSYSWNEPDSPVIPNFHTPKQMYVYRPDKGAWRHVSDRKMNAQRHHVPNLMLITWNISFDTDYLHDRLLCVLRHCQNKVLKCPDDDMTPIESCIMFQEVHSDALGTLLADPWVKRHFQVTPKSAEAWVHGYGNVTLVSKSVAVKAAGVVEFGRSKMARHAVIVDVKLGTAAAHSEEKVLRIINTHLESLGPGEEARQEQLYVLASLLKKKDEVAGGVICGDMNHIHSAEWRDVGDVGLDDAWTRGNNARSGFTWGFQSGETEFPPGRLDKVLYLKRNLYEVNEPERIGVGLKASDRYGVPVIWASDHYGLSSTLRLLGY